MMQKRCSRLVRPVVCLLGLAALSAGAENKVWKGGAFSSDANWNPSGVPSVSDTAIIDGTESAPHNDIEGWNVGEVRLVGKTCTLTGRPFRAGVIELWGLSQTLALNSAASTDPKTARVTVKSHLPAEITDTNAETCAMDVTFMGAAGYVLSTEATKTFSTAQESVGKVGAKAGTVVLGAAGDWREAFAEGTGTLRLSHAAALSDTATLRLSGDGICTIDEGLAPQVAVLEIDGVRQTSGIWGAIGSGAEHEHKNLKGGGRLVVSDACSVWHSAGAIYGGYMVDANVDGRIGSGELIDLRHPTASASSPTRSWFSYAEGEAKSSLLASIRTGATDVVVGSCNNKVLTDEPVLLFDPPTKTEDGRERFVSTFLHGGGETLPKGSHYTCVLRYRPDYSLSKGSDLTLMDIGLYHGMAGLKIFTRVNAAGTGGQVSVSLGGQTPLSVDPNWSNLVSTNNVWHELVVIVDGFTVTLGLRHERIYEPVLWSASEDTRTHYGYGRMNWRTLALPSDKYREFEGGGNCRYSFGIRNTFVRIGSYNFDWRDVGENPCPGFKGAIHRLAYWNRALDKSEALTFLSEGHPRVFRLGAGGFGAAVAGETFAGEPGKDVTVPARLDAWAKLPPKLVKGATVSVEFDLPAAFAGLGSFARLETAATSAPGGMVSVGLDGAEMGEILAKPGRGANCFLPKAALKSAGRHTLTFTRTDGGAADLVVNGFELLGPWQLGLVDGIYDGQSASDDFTANWCGPDPVRLASGSWRDVRGVARVYQGAVTENVQYWPVRLSFTLPPDLVDSKNRYYLEAVTATELDSQPNDAGGRCLGWSFNGSETNWWEGAVSKGQTLSVRLPPSELVAGENTFTLCTDRREPADGSPRGNFEFYFDAYRLRIVPRRGSVVIVR